MIITKKKLIVSKIWNNIDIDWKTCQKFQP